MDILIREFQILYAHIFMIVTVGGGTAGSVLAARLSENPSVTVLVLEAGGDHYDLFFSHVPTAAPLLQGTRMDWGYLTAPQGRACLGLEHKQSRWPRGKCLGGTSILNYMVHGRGSPGDYDHWAALGNEGWRFTDVLPYLRKMEAVLDEQFKKSNRRGTSGPLKVKRLKETPLAGMFLRATKELGYPYMDDYLEADVLEGFSLPQYTIDKGKRYSTASAYLEPAMHRSNLHVVTHAHVTSITINEENSATGVMYTHEGKTHRVLRNREIIISAGAVGSPQLLMLSGLGPKQHLESLGIRSVVDLPAVGENLQDQIIVDLNFEMNESLALTFDDLYNPLTTAKVLLEYLSSGQGLLAAPPIDALGFLRSGEMLPVGDTKIIISDTPDLQFLFFSMMPATLLKHFNLINIQDSVYNDTYNDYAGKPSFSVTASLQQPMSKGNVRLLSDRPSDHPVIHPNYLDAEHDVRVLVKGLQIILKMLDTRAFKQYQVKLLERPLRECASHAFLSEPYLECLVRHRTYTYYHPMGTCRMGSSVETSVVDSSLRVHGVSNLRVADGSVFPAPISGNPAVPTAMIAEKLADLLLGSAKA